MIGIMVALGVLASGVTTGAVEITDFKTKGPGIIPIWADTVEIRTTGVDTSGVVMIEDGGIFSVTVWADSMWTAGGPDTLDIKLEYQLMQIDMDYRTAFTEAITLVHPASRIEKMNNTWVPVKNSGNWWTTIFPSVELYNDRDCKSIQPPLSDGIRFRVTGNAGNDSCYVRIWFRKEP